MDFDLESRRLNRPFSGFLLVSDLDGTLLNSRHEISERNINAIYSFIKGGGKFALATGRGRISIWPYLSKIPVNAPCILYNGAMIYDSVQGLFIKKIDFDTAIIPILKSLHACYPGLGIEIFLEDSVLFYGENQWTKFHKERDGFSAQRIMSLRMDHAWYKIVLTWDPAKLQIIENIYRDRLVGYCVNFSEPHFLDITHLHASKGNALQYLARQLDILPDKTIAVGDNCNDIDMIQKAGFGFAVANACDELKREAKSVCKDNDQHAIWDVVRFLLNEIAESKKEE